MFHGCRPYQPGTLIVQRLPGVVRAAHDLQVDIVRIPGTPKIANEPPTAIPPVIIVGTLDGS